MSDIDMVNGCIKYKGEVVYNTVGEEERNHSVINCGEGLGVDMDLEKSYLHSSQN